jgi:hydroxymethylpyrimidine pyrophosphatase-like HAD family hydrolase
VDILHAGLLCFVDDQLYLICGMHATVAKKFPTYVRCAVEKTHLPRERIMKANVFLDVDQNRIREFTNLLNMHYSDLDFDVAFTGSLNVIPHGWSKEHAIKLLCEAIGCSTDEVVAFGDVGNDLTMLDMAENSVVVNATLEASAAAKWYIGSCAEGQWPERSRSSLRADGLSPRRRCVKHLADCQAECTISLKTSLAVL